MPKDTTPLIQISRELKTLEDVCGLLDWDMQTYMPAKAGAARAGQQALLKTLIHQKTCSKGLGQALKSYPRSADRNGLKDKDRALIRELRRRHDKARKVPATLVEEMARLDAHAFQGWTEAREMGDFGAFAPFLSKQVALNQKLAGFIGFQESPYDALLDYFEPGATAARIEVLFERLKAALLPMVSRLRRAAKGPSDRLLKQSFDPKGQWEFGMALLRRMGFDFEAGRQDRSAHPFTASCGGSDDVRLTTRLNQKDLRPGLFGTMHEGGHGLYEQGLGARKYGLLAAGASCAVHESQARLWENMVGRSLPFWKYGFPRLKKVFPEQFDGVNGFDFYRAINRVAPSFIRVEADEVTYGLHIILRFEMERDLIEGRLKVKDVPETWAVKMKNYLGKTPPNDRLGALQDVHWAVGYFGYFPSYALGNLYAAQFHAAARKAMPDLDGRIARGDFSGLLGWLRKKIHCHGRIYTGEELVKRVTGKPLSPKDFLIYLENKYRAIYKL